MSVWIVWRYFVCISLAMVPLWMAESAWAQVKDDVPATTVAEWQTQIAQSIRQVTSVRIEETETGLDIVLETTEGQLAVPATNVVDNALIADIPNAVLNSPDGDEFQQANPVEGIALVSVTNLPNERIRVAITGTEAAPKVELFDSEEGLIFGVTAAADSTQAERSPQTPQAEQPESETQPGEPSAEGEESINIVVTGAQEGYAVPNASVGTRTDAPLRDIPQSIQVIPQQVLEDQGATELSDALRNVSGVTSGGESIRGFSASERGIPGVFIDGNRQGRLSAFDLSNVEQVEVLKGPASVLYGRGEPGGIVNVVTKQPLTEPAYEIEGRIGNFDFYRGTLDFTGPLNDQRTILYRLNVAYQNTGSIVDFEESESFGIFPVLSFQFSENTTLTLEGGYETTSAQPDTAGLPDNTGSLPLGEVPISRFLSEPDFPETTNTAFYVGYRLDHRFSDDWSLRHQFRADFADYDEYFIGLGELEADNRTVSRFASRFKGTDQVYTLRTEVLGEIQTGIVNQDLLLGVELTRLVADAYFIEREFSSIDLYEPEYGNFSRSDFEPEDEETGPPGKSTSIGVYAQDLVAIGDKVKILLGGRFDWLQDSGFNFSDGETEITDFSPRVGIVYQPIQPVSLYANYAGSFSPQFGRDREGNLFVPITGEQFEVGVKAEFLDGRLAATLAAYQITRTNDFVPDPIDDNFEIQVGESRSRGIEFDLRGEPIPGLSLIATYAYIDAEITEDPSGFEGSRLPNVPQHSGSLWAVYELQEGTLEGLGFGAGVFYADESLEDVGSTETNPSS